MPVQLTLRSPKGGRVLHESTYEDGHRIDAVSGWLVVVDRNGSVVAAHAACPGLEGAIVEHASAAARPDPSLLAGGHMPATPVAGLDQGGYGDSYEGEDDDPIEERDPVTGYPALDRRLGLNLGEAGGTEPLDEQVARLAGWIVENVDGEPSRSEGAIDCALRLLDAWQRQIEALREAVARDTVYREEVEEQTARAEREHAKHLQVETLLRAEVARLTALVRSRSQWETAPADDDLVPHEPTDLRPVEEDPRRPHLDAWPDDAVLLRYRELRRLVALHLERYEATPDVVRAMLEGDVPLRVSEVLS